MRLKERNGFSLVELIFVVVVIGIIAAIAIPNFLNWLPNMRLKAATRELYSNMQNAKIEAVKRRRNVVVALNTVNCPALPVIPAARGTYSVFIDDGAGALGVANDNIQNGTEPTISNGTMPNNVALCGQNFAGATTGFTPTGLLIGLPGSATLSNSSNNSNSVTLSIAGRVIIQ